MLLVKFRNLNMEMYDNPNIYKINIMYIYIDIEMLILGVNGRK